MLKIGGECLAIIQKFEVTYFEDFSNIEEHSGRIVFAFSPRARYLAYTQIQDAEEFVRSELEPALEDMKKKEERELETEEINNVHEINETNPKAVELFMQISSLKETLRQLQNANNDTPDDMLEDDSKPKRKGLGWFRKKRQVQENKIRL